MTDTTLDELFAPPAEQWVALSPRYTNLRRWSAALNWGLLAVIAEVSLLVFVPDKRYAIAFGVTALLFVLFRVMRQGKIAASYGYVERESDLYIRRGIFIKHLTAVPYGRMQTVEVTSGPLRRHYNVATVQLVTASAETDATIPGLEPSQAEALRGRLLKRGADQAAGL